MTGSSVEQKVERDGWAIRVVAGDQKGGNSAEVTIHVGDEPTAAQIKSARKAVALTFKRAFERRPRQVVVIVEEPHPEAVSD